MSTTMKFTAAALLLAGASARSTQHRGSLRGAVLQAGEGDGLNFGTDSCKCIGFQGMSGETAVNFGNETHPSRYQYPAEVGSYCKAWDKGVKQVGCAEGEEPSPDNEFCGNSWCIVDACSCTGVENPPKMLKYIMKDAVYKGMPLYYSYSTCGSDDLWTEKQGVPDCTHAKDEAGCDKLGTDCTWGKTVWGDKCLAWEAGGLCMDLPEQSVYGDHKCPCIGLHGSNTTVTVKFSGEKHHFTEEVGSQCKVWDMDDPMCQDDPEAPGCGQPWCFVDPSHCEIESMRSDLMPDVTFQGQPLHFSLATCGGKVEDKKEKKEEKKEEETEEKAEKEEPEHKEEEQEHEKDVVDSEERAEEKEDEEELKDIEERVGAEPSTGPEFNNGAYKDEWHQEWRKAV